MRAIATRSARAALVVLACWPAILVGFATQATAGEGPWSLRWRWETGRQLSVYVVQTTTTRVGEGQAAQTFSAAAAMNLTWQAERVDAAGNAQLCAHFTRFRFKTLSGSSPPLEYDSDRPAKTPEEFRNVDATLRALRGAPFRFTLSASGEIRDVTPQADTQSRLETSPAGDQLKSLLSREGLQTLLQQSLGRLPERPVAVGESWLARRTAASPRGELGVETRFTCLGVEAGAVEGHVTVRVQGRVSASPGAEGDIESVLKEQELSGEFVFDAKTGRIARSRTKLQLGSTLALGDHSAPLHSETELSLRIEDMPAADW